MVKIIRSYLSGWTIAALLTAGAIPVAVHAAADSCCKPGAACCYPGSPCCAGHHKHENEGASGQKARSH